MALLALLVLIMGGSGAAATVSSSPAAAAQISTLPAIPTGTDCLRPPAPESPNSGATALIDSGPAKPGNGDPFDKKSGVSLYEVYGYGGYSVYVFDPGCIDMTRLFDPDNAKANIATTLSAVVIAVTVKMTRVVTDSTFGKLFDPIQEKAMQIVGSGLFWPLLTLSLGVTALVILSRSRRGDVAGETSAAVKALTILAAAAACLLYVGLFASTVDTALVGAFKAGGQSAQNISRTSTTSGDAADIIGANLVDSVLYPSWAAMTFGNNAEAAKEFGPALFKAGALTRAEQAAIDAHPDTAAKVIDDKKNEYKAVAKKIQDKYPQAYDSVAGNHSDDQMWNAILTLVIAIAATWFLTYALVRLVWAMVVVRVGFSMAPAVALIAQVPRWTGTALELLTWVVQALVQAVAFAFVFNIFLVGAVGGIMSPDNGWNPLIRAIALIMAGIALRSVLGRLGLTGGPWSRIGSRKFKRSGGRGGGRGGPHEKPVFEVPPGERPPARTAGAAGGKRSAGGTVQPSRTAAPALSAGPTARPVVYATNVHTVGAAAELPMVTRQAALAFGAAGAPGVGTVASGTVIAGTLVRSSVTHQAASRALPGGRVAPSQTQSTGSLAGAAASSGAGAAFSGRGGSPAGRVPASAAVHHGGGGVNAPYRPASASVPDRRALEPPRPAERKEVQ